MTSVLPRVSVEALDDRVLDDRVLDDEIHGDSVALDSVELGGLVFDDPDFADDPEFAGVARVGVAGVVGVAGAAAAKPVRELTERQRGMLIFERLWWRHAGSKEQAIREQFDLSATRYYQALNRLLETPEALAFDPLVVGRLRRLRATRSRTRKAT